MIALDPNIYSHSVTMPLMSEVSWRNIRHEMIRGAMHAGFLAGSDAYDEDTLLYVFEQARKQAYKTEVSICGVEAATGIPLWYVPSMLGTYMLGCDQTHIQMNTSLMGVDINIYKG
jgi:hypothetical protein